MSGGRWSYQCGEGKCWRNEHVLKFEPFHGIFPRNINFGDVDAILEYMGEFLLMEWKADIALWDSIDGTGQDKLHERLVESGPFTVLQVVGNAGTTNPTHFRVWTHMSQTRTDWYTCTQARLKEVIASWRDKVEKRNSTTEVQNYG